MEFDFSQRNIFGDEATPSCAELLIREFEKRGCVVESFVKLFRIKHADQVCFIHVSDTSFTSTMASKIWKNKVLTKKVLREAGISVPRGRSFGAGDMQQARLVAKRLEPVVVKPVDGDRGVGVSVNVSARDFPDAWAAAKTRASGRIIVEKFFPVGREARYLVVDNKCVAVSFRFAPSVCGDGVSTVAELVHEENYQKSETNLSRVSSLIELDAHRCNLLAAKGLSPQSVLPEGQELVLDNKTNISTGGYCHEVGTLVHDSYKKIAERVARSVPGSHVLGVDIIAVDHTVEAKPDNYVVLEANTAPGFDLHMFPDYGKPNDVAAVIVDSCLEKMEAGASIS